MKKQKGTRGAISVFLAIILVPCIVVSSVFVDLSRVHLSKTTAESSADLALNALLTNYDADLKDWYGMVASCQNIDEFYEVSANYFLRTISSQNLSDEEIILLSDYYSAATGDDTIYDLLKIECKTGTDKIVSAVKNANLSNAALLKDQVVEFMKYRAPIQIAEDIFSMIKNPDGTTSKEVTSVLESDENKDLVDAKQEFYAAEGELLTAAFYTYWAIRDYYEAASGRGYNNEKLVEYANKINGYKTSYAYIHNAVVKNLYNTSTLTGAYIRVNSALDKYNSTFTKESEEVYSRKVTENNITTYYIDGTDINQLLQELHTSIGSFDEVKEDFSSAAAGLMGNLPGTGDYQANAVQWWKQMNDAVNASSGENSHTSKLKTAADNMLKAYSKVLAIKACTLGNGIPEGWEEQFTELTGEVVSRQAKYLTKGVSDSTDSYLVAVNKLEEVSAANVNAVKASGVTVTIDGQTKTVAAAIPYVATQLSNLRAELQGRIDEIDIAVDGDGDKVKSLTDLTELAKTYNTSFGSWSSTAYNTETELGRADREDIAGMTLEKSINAESVTELKSRLKNIRSQLQDLVDAIDSMKYGNKKVIEIEDTATLKTQAQLKVSSGNIKLKNKEIDEYAGSTFGQLFKPTSSKVITLNNTTGNSHNPDINPEETNAVDTPELFVHMHREFQDTTREKFSSAEKDKADAKEAQDKYIEEQKDAASEYRGNGSNITKEYSDGNKYSAGTGLLTSVCGLFKDIINGDFGKIRDDIFVTTYITNMFSYATYDYEAMYELLDVEDRKSLTPSNAKETYDKKVLGAADKQETWLSTDLTDTYNKSLTNKMINQTNNAAYLAEIEYILYGKDTNKANIKTAFGEIYTFRLVLNTVSAFQHFWTPQTGNLTSSAIAGISNAISGAFGFVIPALAIKAVLLPILAAVETCIDNNRLSKGMPVELYKVEHEDWWLSISTRSEKGFGDFFNTLKEGVDGTGKNQDEGFSYSDYLTIFLYTGLSGGGEVEDDMYERMAEVIQANMRKLIGKDSTYSIAKSRVYFKVNATIRVKPLMIAMPIFNDYENNLDTNTDWCTYKINTVRGYS